jgi:hypothetical protein
MSVDALVARSPAERRELGHAAGAAGIYVSVVALRDVIVGWIGLPSTVSVGYLRAHGSIYELGILALYLPPILALLLLARKWPGGLLRSALRPPTTATLLGGFFLMCAISVAMDWLRAYGPSFGSGRTAPKGPI